MRIGKAAIIGAGFMGGSLALALKKKRIASSVWVVARNPKRARQIRSLRVFDKVTADCAKAVKGASLVVLATPVSSIIEYLPKLPPLLDAGCVVTDMGSTKSLIMRTARRHLADKFVGSHPLCGSEKRGARYAEVSLFKGCYCIVTPSKRNRAFDFVQRFWKNLDCKVAVFDEAEHDRILAYISALPHLVSYSLTATLPCEFARFAAASYRDLTRISASSGTLWTDIFLSNSRNLNKATEKFQNNLRALLKAISRKKRSDLRAFLIELNRKHKKFIG